jgi:hypothetical protein
LTTRTPRSFSARLPARCEGIVSKRIGSPYRSGRSAQIKNPNPPAVNARPRRIRGGERQSHRATV